jgi:hypothetical protein
VIEDRRRGKERKLILLNGGCRGYGKVVVIGLIILWVWGRCFAIP